MLTLADGKVIDFVSNNINLDDISVRLDVGESTATLKIDNDDPDYNGDSLYGAMLSLTIKNTL